MSRSAFYFTMARKLATSGLPDPSSSHTIIASSHLSVLARPGPVAEPCSRARITSLRSQSGAGDVNTFALAILLLSCAGALYCAAGTFVLCAVPDSKAPALSQCVHWRSALT